MAHSLQRATAAMPGEYTRGIPRRHLILTAALSTLAQSGHAQSLAAIPGVSNDSIRLAHFGPLSGILAPANSIFSTNSMHQAAFMAGE
jgi:hypothetical protein